MARVASAFAGKNAKAADFMMWPKEDKAEVTPQNMMKVLQASAAVNNRKDKDGEQVARYANRRSRR